MIQKEIKYNLLYDDVRGWGGDEWGEVGGERLLMAATRHNTSSSRTKSFPFSERGQNKSQKRIAFRNKEHTKPRKSENKFD